MLNIYMKKSQYSLSIILLLEVLSVILTSIGIFPREAVLILTGLLVFYFIFSRTEDSLVLFILSIPLFVALPIAGYDSMANWRILLAVLFLVWLSKKISWKTKLAKIKTAMKGLFWLKKMRTFKLFHWTLLFLFIGGLSLIVAVDKVAGIKKLLFLINIFLLFPIIREAAKDKKQKKRIIKAGAGAAGICLAVGYSQLIATFLTPLHNFWQWWANKVIPVFYGDNLGKLLAKSNTWFSYYEDGPPTLRMFSVFPDSHSLALFIIIGLIFLTVLLFRKIKSRKIWLMVVLSFLGLAFSGSRGIWVSAIIPFLIIILLLIFGRKFKLKFNAVHKKVFISLLFIFILSFPVSSLIMSASQGGGNGTLAFKRAKTVMDTDELSVKSRIGIWKSSFSSILKRPLLGVGIGNYPVVLSQEISAAKKGSSAHNLYLDITSEMGILGLIALGLIILELLKTSWKSIKKNNSYSLVFSFFLVWILIYSLFDVVLLNDKVVLFFLIALSLLYSSKKHE